MTKKQNLNAVKHGAFSKPVLLPGEDRKEFQELHDALIAEWEPDGPTEHGKVLSVAVNMWRKERVRRWLQKEINACNDIAQSMFVFYGLDKIKPPIQFLKDYKSGELRGITEENISTKLDSHWSARVKEAVPRSNYDSDAHWLEAITGYILTVDPYDFPGIGEVVNLQERFSVPHFALDELAFEERIDAKIAKDLKELGQIKTMKAIGIGKRQTRALTEIPKLVAAPSIQAGVPAETLTNTEAPSIQVGDDH